MKRNSMKVIGAICFLTMVLISGCKSNDEYDFGGHFFRNSDYNDSVESVKAVEKSTLAVELTHETNPKMIKEGETFLEYDAVIDGYDAKISYRFRNDGLVYGSVVISGAKNPDKYAKSIQKTFEKNYGEPPVTIPYPDYHGTDHMHRLVYAEGDKVYITISDNR